MTISKIMLTQEQAQAIQFFLEHHKGDKAFLLNLHASKRPWTGKIYPAMNDLDQSDMARALLIGYDVEVSYKVGEWVTFTVSIFDKGLNDWKPKTYVDVIVEVSETGMRVRTKNYGINLRTDKLRYATPEEIKTVKDRQLWDKIGRKVGEFRKGDFVINSDGVLVRLTDNRKAEAISERYLNGEHFKGFFPAESFISFEDGEEDV